MRWRWRARPQRRRGSPHRPSWPAAGSTCRPAPWCRRPAPAPHTPGVPGLFLPPAPAPHCQVPLLARCLAAAKPVSSPAGQQRVTRPHGPRYDPGRPPTQLPCAPPPSSRAIPVKVARARTIVTGSARQPRGSSRHSTPSPQTWPLTATARPSPTSPDGPPPPTLSTPTRLRRATRGWSQGSRQPGCPASSVSAPAGPQDPGV